MSKHIDNLSSKLDDLQIEHRVMEDVVRVNRVYIRHELLDAFVKLMKMNENVEQS